MALLAKRFFGVVAAVAVMAACDGDEASDVDAPPDVVDGMVADAGGDAPPGPCPGQLAYEAEVLDWVTGQGIFEATASEVGNEANTAQSAPNGRVVLCLPPAADYHDVRIEAEGYLARTNRVVPSAEQLREAMPAPATLLTPEDANEVYQVTPERAFLPNASHALVDVRLYPGGEPLAGALVSLENVDPSRAYARAADGSFTAGNTVGEGGVILFANVIDGNADAAITVEGPAGFTGTCTAANTIPLIAGEFTYTLVACQN